MRHGSLTLDKNMEITDNRNSWYLKELKRIRALPDDELLKEFYLRVDRNYLLRVLKDCLKEESVLHGRD